jgi:hypothetical protein
MAKNNKAPLKKTKVGKSALKSPKKKTNCVRGRRFFIGGRVVSVVFHPFDGVLSIVDGLFSGIVAIFVVCYIEVAVCVVDDFEHQEKTRPKRR